jgi:hypothetical protein
MGLTTVIDKKENGKRLREFHQPTFENLGIVNPTLYGKMFYFAKGGTAEKYVSLFFSEISKGNDIYLESTNRDLVPEDVERTLYLWRFNPHFQEEYEMTEPELTSNTRFLIPISELKVIKKYTAEEVEGSKEPKIIETDIEKEIIENKVFDFNSPVKLTDKETPITEMTIRDFAAIILKKPVSRKEWLNEIIKSK